VKAILSAAESVKKAEEAIKNKDWESATVIYNELNKRMPGDERFYDRLMMLYRRQNMLKNELDIINRRSTIENDQCRGVFFFRLFSLISNCFINIKVRIIFVVI